MSCMTVHDFSLYKGNVYMMSSPHLYIVVALFPSVKLIVLLSKIMSRFTINIYSPVNLKKTFSIFFTELSTHYPTFGQFL